jgi:thiosulfate dehydrogenase
MTLTNSCSRFFYFLKIQLFTVIVFFQTGCKNDLSETVSKDSTTYRNELLVDDEWKAPDTSTIPHDEKGNLIRYGRDLVVNTSNYFGPHGTINKFSNKLNCQNCHLDAGTKLYGNSFAAVFSIYPKVRPRSGTLEHLERRINDCFERSMNGKKLDSLSREMRAMVSYINWVGKDVKKGTTPKGTSVVDLKFMNRPADPEKGRIAFEKTCTRCHGSDGQGKMDSTNTIHYPPLWGEFSFNSAAGLYRLSRMAGFIKSNMPYQQSSFENPTLTDEEAWDIAAYINSNPRPVKIFSKDWPDISKKPFDHPSGPFTDNYSETQHKYGPFQPIVEAHKKN